MGLFPSSRDPLEAEMRRLEREARELEDQARRIEAGLGAPPVQPASTPPATKLTFPDLPEPSQAHEVRPSGSELRVRRRQIKLQVLAMGAVCLILGVLVARVLGWM